MQAPPSPNQNFSTNLSTSVGAFLSMTRILESNLDLPNPRLSRELVIIQHQHLIGAWLAAALVVHDFKAHALVLPKYIGVRNVVGVHKHVLGSIVGSNEPEASSLNVKRNFSSPHLKFAFYVFARTGRMSENNPAAPRCWRGGGFRVRLAGAFLVNRQPSVTRPKNCDCHTSHRHQNSCRAENLDPQEQYDRFRLRFAHSRKKPPWASPAVGDQPAN